MAATSFITKRNLLSSKGSRSFTDRVVASADTPQEVMRLVAAKGLRNTAIVRVPRADEHLRVGLG